MPIVLLCKLKDMKEFILIKVLSGGGIIAACTSNRRSESTTDTLKHSHPEDSTWAESPSRDSLAVDRARKIVEDSI